MIKELFVILFASAFINNIILSQFLGLCPLMGTTDKMKSAFRMGPAVIVVITLASLFNGLVYHYVLLPLGIVFLQTLVFIVVIIGLVKLIELIMVKCFDICYKSIGLYLPILITNCVVLGAVLINSRTDFDVLYSTFNGFSFALGFALVLLILAGIREKIALNNVPESFRGLPILLLIAGLMSMAFFGFSLLF